MLPRQQAYRHRHLLLVAGSVIHRRLQQRLCILARSIDVARLQREDPRARPDVRDRHRAVLPGRVV